MTKYLCLSIVATLFSFAQTDWKIKRRAANKLVMLHRPENTEEKLFFFFMFGENMSRWSFKIMIWTRFAQKGFCQLKIKRSHMLQ
jgi:hypothetical protein